MIARFLACFLCLAAHGAETVSVAAAANLSHVLQPLDAAFEADHPGVGVTSGIASSGNLVALIGRGAPYDVFLSADLEYPRQLIAAGAADSSTLVTFAYGKLALWTTRPGLELRSVSDVLRSASVREVAVANPRTAPYGRAAVEVVAKLGLEKTVQPKLIFGENISMTAQYVSTGNADIGFVALSLLLAPQLKGQGRWIEIPANLYSPIAEGAVLTRRGQSNSAARAYLRFLASAPARRIFQQFGYGLP
jgi:molybdate transport system substrate-binding protein